MLVKLAGSTLSHAEHELDLIGMKANSKDEMNRMMRKNILEVIKTFGKQGHSGFSANYAIGILQKLLRHEPLSPLTGKPEEWNDVSEMYSVKPGEKHYQNKRASHVFKEVKNGKVKVYDINGKRFVDKDGCSYTSKGSRVKVKFPYTPKTETVKR
jgi:hypothetical protein